MPLRFRLIAFDLDGVLVDTTSAHARAYADLWTSLDVEGPPYAHIAGRRTVEVVTEITRAQSPSQNDIAEWVRFKQRRAREYLLTEPIEFPDTAEAMRRLSSQAGQLALGTGASRETAYAVLRRLGFLDLFNPVVTAEDVRAGKPSPEVYLRIMERTAALPAETLIVEDSAAGLAAALDSGAFAVTVRTEEWSDHPHFLGRFANLHELLRPPGFAA